MLRFIDVSGQQKYIDKLIFGILAQNPNYALIVIDANKKLNKNI